MSIRSKTEMKCSRQPHVPETIKVKVMIIKVEMNHEPSAHVAAKVMFFVKHPQVKSQGKEKVKVFNTCRGEIVTGRIFGKNPVFDASFCCRDCKCIRR